jgi:hypothetical protein
MDIEPMRRNMMMKNVAGFQSLDFGCLGPFERDLERARSGLGIREVQKDGWVMLWMLEE